MGLGLNSYQWYTDGANDIENNNIGTVKVKNNLEIGGTIQLQLGSVANEISIDGTLAGNSDKAIPTEQAVKTYLDAIGLRSVAMGWNTYAFEKESTAMGSSTKALGKVSTAMGALTVADGDNSIAMGFNTEAYGNNSTTMGHYTIATEDNSVAMGQYNLDYSNALLMIGNGSGSGAFERSNALTVLKNGTIIAPSFDLSEIIDPKSLVTKEYMDAIGTTSGLEKITEYNSETETDNTGWRLKDLPASTYGPIGNNEVDLSIWDLSTSETRGATGSFSTAMGRITTASGYASTATGSGTIASGNYSISMGRSTQANSYMSMAIGKNNIGGGDGLNWVETDPLFEIGNGSSNSNRNNALTVLKNGNVGVGIHTPTSLLEVAHQDSPPTANNLTNAFSIRNLGNDESWQLYTGNGTDGYLLLFKDGNFRGSFNSISGAYVQASDKRVKRNIASLENGTLQKVMQLNPVSYLMKDQTDTERNLGLISQEVQEIFPTLTHYVKESDLLSLSYTELIPVLIKAIQEQQVIIEGQNTKIEGLSAQVAEIKTLLERKKQ